jgi:hypothetical protein
MTWLALMDGSTIALSGEQAKWSGVIPWKSFVPWLKKFCPDASGVAIAERVIKLEDLLDQIGADGLAGLDPVPGTAGPEVAHHRDRASKR